MAWHKVFAAGLFGAALAFGCTVTSSDGDDEGDGGSGGSGTGSGGSAGDTGGSGGGSDSDASTGSGGTAGGGSGGASGGGAGGGGGSDFVCDPTDDTLGDCDKCVHEKCCDELSACTTDACAGTDSSDGEVLCVIDCMDTKFLENGGGDPSQGFVDIDNDYATCLGDCAVGSEIGIEAEDLFICILDAPGDAGTRNCGEVCLNIVD